MTWHLKDRELEKKLIEICPDFLEYIEFAIQTKEKDADYIYVEFERERENVTLGFNHLYFWDDELEEVVEYDPHVWNEFPKVKPPYDVMMRIEMYNGLGFAGFFKHFIEGDQWCYADGSPMPKAYSNNVKRFRPWSDD